MNTKLQYHILKHLSKNEKTTSADLQRMFSLSHYYVVKYISELNEKGKPYHVEITTKRGYKNGYSLIYENEELLKSFIKNQEEHLAVDNYDFGDEAFRRYYICFRLLCQNDMFSLADLADEVHYSVRVLNDDMKSIRAFLLKYNLEVRNNPHSGLFLAGGEFDRRQCIRSVYHAMNVYLSQRDRMMLFFREDYTGKTAEMIRIVSDVLFPIEFMISESTIRDIMLRCIIAFNCQSACFKREDAGIYSNLVTQSDHLNAKSILERLSSFLRTSYAEEDINDIAINIIGHRKYSPMDPEDKEIKGLTERIITDIDEKYQTNLKFDSDFIKRFYLHVLSLVKRVQLGVIISSQLSETIQSKYPLAFDMAYYASIHINQFIDKPINDDEISFLALEFESRKNTGKRKQNILLVSNIGYSGTEVLKNELWNRFSNYVNQISVCSYSDWQKQDINAFNLVLHTDVKPDTNLKCIRVDDFLDHDEIEQIFEALKEPKTDQLSKITKLFPKELFIAELNIRDKNDVLSYMTANLGRHYKIPENFLAEVLRREDMSTTDYSNNVAIPHTLLVGTSNTLCSVAILKKPVFWGRKKVQLVMLGSVEYGSDDLQLFYSYLTYVASSEFLVNEIIRSKSYDTMIQFMLNKTEDVNLSS